MSVVRDWPAAETRGGFVAHVRRLPVVSWIWPEHHSAEAGASCGLVGGACCVGGAVVKGLGIASVATISSFVETATPYFIGASVLLMLAWAVWLFRRTRYQVKPFTRMMARHGAVMAGIYAVTLGATMALASVAGISM